MNALKAENKPNPRFKGPLLVIMHFRIPIPKKLITAKRLAMHRLPHVLKPDGDNLEKFLSDAMKDVLWADDAQIVWLLRTKSRVNAREGSTTIFVKELDNEFPNYEEIIDIIKQHINLEENNGITQSISEIID